MNRTHLRVGATDQYRFAISAKALLLATAVMGGSFLAVGKMIAQAPDPALVTQEPVMSAPVAFTDPDAELRPWLREAQAPTF
ncbi:MAG: hypothetical protein ACKVQT_21305 [Burkholderiales bacterium]